MNQKYRILGDILFSQSLIEIRQQLELLKKDQFEPNERIVIRQDVADEYSYTDLVGNKLIEIQKILNQIDISNCFIVLITTNPDVAREIDFVTKYYAVDPDPINFELIDGDYQKNLKRYPDTACKKLWNHFYIGTDGNVNVCCLGDHRFPLGHIDDINVTDTIKINADRVRSDMLQGLRNRACSVCYEKEDSGIQSSRQEVDCSTQKVQIQDVDIRLSNICNFKCRMCSEYSSSAIQQETIELYSKNAVLGFEKILLDNVKKKEKNRWLDKILPMVNRDIESIYFAGGEPLMMHEHYEILDRLIMIKNVNIRISYNTNLSKLTYKNQSAIEKWHQFNDIMVGASIDASGAVAEYLRHGTIWDDIVANICTIKEQAPHVLLKITSTASNLNIENLIDLQHTWINQRFFSVDDFKVKPLVAPNFFSPAALPQHHKERLGRIIKQHICRYAGSDLAKQWHDVLQWMNNNDYTFTLKDFAHRTRTLDSHRNESFELVFPEYKDLI